MFGILLCCHHWFLMETGSHQENGNQGRKGVRRGIVKKGEFSFVNGMRQSYGVFQNILEAVMS